MSPRPYLLAFAVILPSMSAVSAHAKSIKILMDKLEFAPVEVTATVGDTIEWINNDILAHTATARNGDWDVAIAAKKTMTLILTRTGTVEYYCRYHPNMKGRIVVDPQ